jgi:nicotinate-nucleotide adenylyltransferase
LNAKKKKVIGLTGGSFNPPTLGHLDLAQLVLSFSEVEEVWMVPCYDHLQKEAMVGHKHRLAMCELTVKDIPNVKVCDYEIKHKLDGSAFDFITKLMEDEDMQPYSFRYIIGMDNAVNIDTWKNSEELIKLIPFIIVAREGVNDLGNQNDAWYEHQPHFFINQKVRSISSTAVRMWLKNCVDPSWGSWAYERLKQEMNPEVINYILNNHIYL